MDAGYVSGVDKLNRLISVYRQSCLWLPSLVGADTIHDTCFGAFTGYAQPMGLLRRLLVLNRYYFV